MSSSNFKDFDDLALGPSRDRRETLDLLGDEFGAYKKYRQSDALDKNRFSNTLDNSFAQDVVGNSGRNTTLLSESPISQISII